jgi:hypothetical protein
MLSSRLFLVALFSLLMIGMQRELFVHEVEHLRARVELGDQSGLQQPSSDHCAECVLLAGTGSTIAVTVPAPIAPPLFNAAPRSCVEAPTLPAPAYYSSRAPPAVL